MSFQVRTYFIPLKYTLSLDLTARYHEDAITLHRLHCCRVGLTGSNLLDMDRVVNLIVLGTLRRYLSLLNVVLRFTFKAFARLFSKQGIRNILRHSILFYERIAHTCMRKSYSLIVREHKYEDYQFICNEMVSFDINVAQWKCSHEKIKKALLVHLLYDLIIRKS